MTLNEKRKKYAHEYYLKHKKEMLEKQREWRKNNKEKFYKLIYKSRKKKAERLKEQGEMYMWHSEKERKMLNERRINRSIKKNEISNTNNTN